LQRADAAIAQRAGEALLTLYALDAKIARATSRADALRAQRERIRAQRASVRRQLDAAQTTLRAAQRQLALRLHALYVRRGTDALAVLLGASSLADAAGQLETLDRSAQLDDRIAMQARRARGRLRLLAARLAQRDAHLREVTAEAESTLAALVAARDQRRLFLSELTQRRRLGQEQIERLKTRSRTLAARTTAPARTTAAVPVATAQARIVSARSTLTVVATGYSATGATATGIAAGPGVVAVDPSVIPFGTGLTIPGYGEGVAADTGSAVVGASIDLWFATAQEARAWGRRTVVVTLH